MLSDYDIGRERGVDCEREQWNTMLAELFSESPWHEEDWPEFTPDEFCEWFVKEGCP